jgi:predicted RNase H-like HicB family nuclease
MLRVREGDTVEQALANIREAIEAYLLSLKDDNLPIPTDDVLLGEIEVTA